MGYFDWSNFGTGAQQAYTPSGAWGSGESQNPLVQGLQQGTDLFKQQFKNMLGRDPTADELGKFQTTALLQSLGNGQNNLTYGDMTGLSQNYIQNSFPKDMTQFAQQQQQDSLNSTQDQVSKLVNSLNQKTQDYLLNPQTQQTIQGQLNNSGMLNSGAYSQTLAGLMAQGANQNEANALSGISIPAMSNIQGLSGMPFQQQMQQGQGALGNLNNLRDFNMQEVLARQLAQMGQPSPMQQIMGMASGAAGGAGGLLQGGAAAKNATSYICMELIKRDLLCNSDMDDFHVHIMPALFKKGRAFWKYAMDGKQLVDAVNLKGLDWKVFKPLLFDRVMEEPDPFKAVDLYADACHQLCISSDRTLWDGRVYRTSFVDSLPFLPLLFAYTPFLDALWKCLRIKMLWVYDKPRCEIHQ